MEVAIIDYNAGNTTSVANALARLGCTASVSNNAERIAAADKVIFPGVGEASSAMRALQQTGLDSLLPTLRQPVLGICLGMQLMCQRSAEGNTTGLGIFEAQVERFPSRGRVPHTGWNNLEQAKGPLFDGLPMDTDFYFVHSFCVPLCPQSVATCNYLQPFSAALQRQNFYGTQFHPEKSGAAGQQLLQNFLSL